MKKFLSLILTAALTLSLTACQKDDAYSDGVSDASSDLASDNSVSSDTDDNGTESPVILSNPVKKTADGDIDMEAALSYETDFDAFKAEMASREVDLSLPVSLNARENENTMEVFNYLKSIYGK